MSDEALHSSEKLRTAEVVLTPTEQMLTKIMSEAVRRQTVGLEDDFLQLGGQSILAVGVINRVREALGVEVPLQLLLDGKTTVRALSREIDAATTENTMDANKIKQK